MVRDLLGRRLVDPRDHAVVWGAMMYPQFVLWALGYVAAMGSVWVIWLFL